MFKFFKAQLRASLSALLFIALLCCCAACQTNEALSPTEEPAVTSSPAPTDMPAKASATPEAEPKAALHPLSLAVALTEQYEEGSRYLLAKNAAAVFERFGLDSGMLDYYDFVYGWGEDTGIFFSEEDVSVKAAYSMDGKTTAYAALRLSVQDEGLTLVFERQNPYKWVFTGWFPCAEAGLTYYPESEVSYHYVQEKSGDIRWYLCVKGRRDHGTERLSVQTDWYDLTAGKPALRYMSDMYAMWGNRESWLGHAITSTASPAIDGDGQVALIVSYSADLIDREEEPYFWDDIRGSAFYFEDWQIEYACGADGAFEIEDEQMKARMFPIDIGNPAFSMSESISPKSLLTMFPDMESAVLSGGSDSHKRSLNKLLAASKRE